MPRLLCMQRCGEKLAKAIRPTVPTYACSDTRDCTPLNLDSAAVARAEAGLAHCLIECGFPTPETLVSEPPKRVPDPRPPQPEVIEAEPEEEPALTPERYMEMMQEANPYRTPDRLELDQDEMEGEEQKRTGSPQNPK